MSDTETITVPLSRPVKHGEGDKAVTYDAFTFREAVLGDYIAADAVTGDTAKTAAVLAAMAGVPYAAFKKIKMADMNRILAEAGHFLGNEQAPAETGATSQA